MATRQQRLEAFIHEGEPQANQPLELLCEDHVGTYVIPFLCRLSDGVWRSVDTGNRIEATVIGWRMARHAGASNPVRQTGSCKVENHD